METFMRAFMLGLGSGTTCLMSCAPVLIPYLFGEGRGLSRNFLILANFLAGRLFGYMAVGVASWYIGRSIFQNAVSRQISTGVAFLSLSIIMIFYGVKGLKKDDGSCCAAAAPGAKNRLPLAMGFLTATNLCPPLILAAVDASGASGPGYAVVFFLAFFLGTSIHFLFLPIFSSFCAAEKRMIAIGRYAALLIGSYYLYQGVLKTAGGIVMAGK